MKNRPRFRVSTALWFMALMAVAFAWRADRRRLNDLREDYAALEQRAKRDAQMAETANLELYRHIERQRQRVRLGIE